MIRRILCIALLTTVASFSATRELTAGENMPELRGEYLSGRKAILPKDAAGRVALLLLASAISRGSRWKPGLNGFRVDFEKNPQVTFYEIPMIGGMARLGKWFIDSGMRRGTPKADREHVITVYGGTETWKRRLGVHLEDSAHLVLVDQQGNVAWRHAGPFEETSYQALAGRIRKLAFAQ